MDKQKRRSAYEAVLDETGKDKIWRILAPSFVGIVLCALCLVGLTMAWFSSEVSKPTVRVGTNNFNLECTVFKKDGVNGTGVNLPEICNGVTNLDERSKYYIELSGVKEIGHGDGYAIVILGSDSYISHILNYEGGSEHNDYTVLKLTIKTGEAPVDMSIDFIWGVPTELNSYKRMLPYGVDGANGSLIDLSSKEALLADIAGQQSHNESGSTKPDGTTSSPSQSTTSSSVSSSAESSSQPQSSEPAGGGLSSKASGGSSSEKPGPGSSSGVSSGGAASGGASSAGSSSSSRESEPSPSAASSQPAPGKSAAGKR